MPDKKQQNAAACPRVLFHCATVSWYKYPSFCGCVLGGSGGSPVSLFSNVSHQNENMYTKYAMCDYVKYL